MWAVFALGKWVVLCHLIAAVHMCYVRSVGALSTKLWVKPLHCDMPGLLIAAWHPAWSPLTLMQATATLTLLIITSVKSRTRTKTPDIA
jgi:hypothetical protein